MKDLNENELRVIDGGRIPVLDDIKDTFWEFVEGFKDGWKDAGKK
ncbi:hypothetical protein ACT3CE_13715 [Marinifilum sp. RC60d5]